MGKGTIIQAGKSPLGMAVQISGNQKNKLNDPGGGSFRYILSGESLPFPVSVAWGQHFSKMYTHLQAILSAKAVSVYPSCLHDHLAACLPGCCWCGWSWPPLSLLLSALSAPTT